MSNENKTETQATATTNNNETPWYKKIPWVQILTHAAAVAAGAGGVLAYQHFKK